MGSHRVIPQLAPIFKTIAFMEEVRTLYERLAPEGLKFHSMAGDVWKRPRQDRGGSAGKRSLNFRLQSEWKEELPCKKSRALLREGVAVRIVDRSP